MMFQMAFANVHAIPGIAGMVKEKMITAMALGMGKKDWSSTYEVTRMQAGLKD